MIALGEDYKKGKMFAHLDDSAESHRQRMIHSVTAYDRVNSDRAAKKGTYYNHYALGHYLKAADDAHAAMKKGMSPADAINQHFVGSLAKRLHKHLGTGGIDTDTQRKKTFNEGREVKDLSDILGEELPVRMTAKTYHKDKEQWTSYTVHDKVRGVSRKHILDKAIKKIQKKYPDEKEHGAEIHNKPFQHNSVKELYEPEPKGEKRFVAKHKKELVEPAKKLDDKIFKPSTKKAPYKEAPKVYEGKTEKKDEPVDDKEAREKLRQRRLAFVNENSVEYYDALDKERKANWHYSRAGKNKNASLSKGIEHDYKSQLLKRGVIDAEGKQKSLRAEEVEMLDENVSRKHFQAVAATIKAISDPEKRQEHADMHAETFAHLNKRFDHAKFHAACGTKTKDQRALRSANVNTPGVHVGNYWYPNGHSKYNELRAEETDVSESAKKEIDQLKKDGK